MKNKLNIKCECKKKNNKDVCVCTNLYGGNLQPTKVVQCVHDDPCLTPKMTMD